MHCTIAVITDKNEIVICRTYNLLQARQCVTHVLVVGGVTNIDTYARYA